MRQQEQIPHLFRTEYRKIISVLCKRFGFEQMEMAEDITSDTFLAAAQVWGLNGLPENPVAWLYHVAKNKSKNFLKRDHVFEKKIAPELKSESQYFDEQEIDLSPQNINDSQLQMMFTICDPSISAEAQIGLSLRILCGFGIDEIADAFLSNKETINKRLFRAREKLRDKKIKVELPDTSQIESRLDNVLTTIYLLFNEGYYSLNQDHLIRKDLCLEAMRLCTMLVENKITNKPSANALLSLMCFQASRLEARMDKNGELVLYEDQDENLWNSDLISRGGYFLSQSSSGDRLSKYHIEAAIAFWSTQKSDTIEKWENVLKLYDQLLLFAYTPIVALNRMFVFSKVRGKESAIAETEKLNLTDNPFYYSLLGELYKGWDSSKSKDNFKKALVLIRSESGKVVIQAKMTDL
jgi:RNA polymerase sigma factor (sigma-70 family)